MGFPAALAAWQGYKAPPFSNIAVQSVQINTFMFCSESFGLLF